MSQENAKKRKVDMAKASRNIWLVKVPNYVAKLWDKSPSDMNVATMRVENASNGNDSPKVKLVLSEQLVKLEPNKKIAREHEIKTSKLLQGSQLTGILSTDNDDNHAMEGWISHKMECHPVCNSEYFQMKREARKSEKPLRSAQPLNDIVKNYKPVSSHIHNREEDKRKKEAATRILGREAIMSLLFKAFEKHQYYSLKDLSFLTKQSVFALKAVLKDIGDYSKDPAHKQMWELKKEYRHYQSPESTECQKKP